MYIPSSFEVKDQARLFDVIEQHSFGLLVSWRDGEPFATHLPFLLDRDAGTRGRLIGHVARANPHWEYAEGESVLCVFSGPHAYISPTWYEADKVVPTWNYVAVHAYGVFRAVQEETELMQIVADTVRKYEASMPVPWRLDASSEFNARLLAGIVGFHIDLERLEGKFKLSQNHPVERQEQVARALAAAGGELKSYMNITANHTI